MRKMKKIQTWNKREWIDTDIEQLPLGANIIRVVVIEETERSDDAEVQKRGNSKQPDGKI